MARRASRRHPKTVVSQAAKDELFQIFSQKPGAVAKEGHPAAHIQIWTEVNGLIDTLSSDVKIIPVNDFGKYHFDTKIDILFGDSHRVKYRNPDLPNGPNGPAGPIDAIIHAYSANDHSTASDVNRVLEELISEASARVEAAVLKSQGAIKLARAKGKSELRKQLLAQMTNCMAALIKLGFSEKKALTLFRRLQVESVLHS